MGSEVDKSRTMKKGVLANDENTGAIQDIKNDFILLSETAQQLLTDKIFLENECSRLKKRASRLEEELSNLHAPPFVVGHLQDTVNDNAIVRSSNGTVFLVSINNHISDETLTFFLIKPYKLNVTATIIPIQGTSFNFISK